jgi:hypothetical protein
MTRMFTNKVLKLVLIRAIRGQSFKLRTLDLDGNIIQSIK